MASGFTTTTPVPLYWEAHGPPGVERLLVLHGGPGAHHDYLLPQMLELARDRECLFYDQRGGGRSRHDDDRIPVTWESSVRDLEGVAREFALEPLTIVGYSWGALLALLYAVQAAHGHASPAPARLVLIDPAPASRRWRAEFDAEFARRQQSAAVQALRDELAASGLRETDPVAFRQRTFELSVAGYFAHPRAARALTPFRVTGRVQQSVWDSLGDFDLVPALRDVHCPALVVHGRQDPIPLESSGAVAEALRAELVVLDDCGHVPYVEQAEALFRAIRRFLDRASPTSA
ncbi:MAG: alpha/beta fold hydrolase [Gemmatimonadetes bacterium]|nr:alpha/beta fold hydrolase [Gemmatimonadota bacterium]